MKKVLLIALILTFAAGSAIAQQGNPGSGGGGMGKSSNSQAGGSIGNPVERLTELLGLDETQAAAIALIFEDSQLVREEERERARAAAEEQRANTHAQILEVLTPEQQAIFEEHQQQREALRQALEDLRADRGYGGRRGTGDCNG
jgi:Spy/CpxP family protein refolding chaperone